MRGQAGFWDIDERYMRLSEAGDPLETLNRLVPWEVFRKRLAKALKRSDGAKGGRPPYDPVMMFKIMVLQALYGLSDDQAEFQVQDRLSFMRFLGLGLGDRVPDAKTIWLFREHLTQAKAVENLFARFDKHLTRAGYLAMGGQIVDATIVAAPKQIPWAGWRPAPFLQNEVVITTQSVRRPMHMTARTTQPTAIRTDLGANFVSMELSRSKWLITSISPGSGEKMSKHSVTAGDIAGLFALFVKLRERSRSKTGHDHPIITIQEAGLDGFWIHRVLENDGIESHVVDPASIAVSRRRRRAKTDRIDGEALLRTLMAYKRGEPRVCAMVRAPSVEEEDHRRLCRERKTLTNERVAHVNRIKGLLFSQGITNYAPLNKDRRQRLEELRTGDGRVVPPHLKTQICRELHRLELLLEQIKTVEDERDALISAQATAVKSPPAKMLLEIKGVGAEFAAVLSSECLFRKFDNRRQVAAYAGLAPTPWQSGSIDREQGVSKAGNPRLRTTLIQMSWLWLQHQPNSSLSQWFKDRVQRNGGRMKKSTIVALARKLLVALWKYVTSGVVIEGAVMKRAG